METLLNPFSPSVRKTMQGGPADYHDPNPVHSEIVYNQMAKNFPPDAIQWVKNTKWIGPIQVPWSRIDTDDKDKWAALHQPEKVKEFEKLITMHRGHVAPSILVQEENSPKAFIVDGHHRAVAHENLKQDVLAYLGHIDAKDRQAALETHSKQFHAGSDPRNKDLEGLLGKLEGFWYRREIGLPVSRKEVFRTLVELRKANRDVRLLALQAQDFGWSIEQLDNEHLRSWLCGLCVTGIRDFCGWCRGTGRDPAGGLCKVCGGSGKKPGR